MIVLPGGALQANDVGTLPDKFVGLARVMDGKYGWRPSQGVRSVGDVFSLIVMENDMLAGLLTGTGAQGGGGMGGRGNQVTVPVQMQEALRTSYDALKQALSGLSDGDLKAHVKMFGRKNHEAGCRPDAAVRPAQAHRSVYSVEASRADIEALTGEWDGTYSSRDTGRGGSIWFRLIAGEDHAHGDVLLTPAGGREAYSRNRPSGGWPPGEALNASHVLTIPIAQVSGGLLYGRLDPYWDPDCGCEALTVFRGRLSGDTLQGSFSTHLGSGLQASGRWVSHRRRPGKPGTPSRD